MDDASHKMDLTKGWGIGLAVGGTLSLAAGIVLLAVAPKRPKEPPRPVLSLGTEKLHIALSPALSPELAGLGVSATF